MPSGLPGRAGKFGTPEVIPDNEFNVLTRTNSYVKVYLAYLAVSRLLLGVVLVVVVLRVVVRLVLLPARLLLLLASSGGSPALFPTHAIKKEIVKAINRYTVAMSHQAPTFLDPCDAASIRPLP